MQRLILTFATAISIFASAGLAVADVVVSCYPDNNRLLVEYYTNFGVPAVRAKNDRTTQIVDLWDLVTIEKYPKRHEYAGAARSVASEKDKIISCRLANSLYQVVIKPLPFNPDDLQGDCGAAITGTVAIKKDNAEFLKETLLQSQNCDDLDNVNEEIVSTIEVVSGEKNARVKRILNTGEYKLSESSTWTFAPSFDCTKILNAAEKLVCSDRELAGNDVLLSRLYKDALARTADKGALKTEQNTWRKKVRDACSDRKCLQKAYGARIRELQGYVRTK